MFFSALIGMMQGSTITSAVTACVAGVFVLDLAGVPKRFWNNQLVKWEDYATTTHKDFVTLPPDVYLHSAFANAAYEVPRDGGEFYNKLRGYTRLDDWHNNDYSIFKRDDSETYIVAVRGTSQAPDLLEDLHIAFKEGPKERVKKVKEGIHKWLRDGFTKNKSWNPTLSIAGHSLGGTVAMMVFDKLQRDKEYEQKYRALQDCCGLNLSQVNLHKSYSYNPGFSFAGTDEFNKGALRDVVCDPAQIICMVDGDVVCSSLGIILRKFGLTANVNGIHVINNLAFHRRWGRNSFIFDWVNRGRNLIKDRLQLHFVSAFFTLSSDKKVRSDKQLRQYLDREKRLVKEQARQKVKLNEETGQPLDDSTNSSEMTNNEVRMCSKLHDVKEFRVDSSHSFIGPKCRICLTECKTETVMYKCSESGCEGVHCAHCTFPVGVAWFLQPEQRRPTALEIASGLIASG